jgi:hypothetical protein
VGKVQGFYHTYFTRRNQILGLILSLVVLTTFNYTYAVHKQIQPSLLTKYSKSNFPTWLHNPPSGNFTSAPQLLSLPPSLAPGLLPSKFTLLDAKKKYSQTWHPDHWQRNGLDSIAQAQRVYLARETCANAVLKWYENPYCLNNTVALQEYEPDPALPHFKPGCTCTRSKALINTFKMTVIPFDLQSASPQTRAEFTRHCPRLGSRSPQCRKSRQGECAALAGAESRQVPSHPVVLDDGNSELEQAHAQGLGLVGEDVGL